MPPTLPHLATDRDCEPDTAPEPDVLVVPLPLPDSLPAVVQKRELCSIRSSDEAKSIHLGVPGGLGIKPI